MRERYGKTARKAYGKQYRLSDKQVEMVTRLLYDRVVRLQDNEGLIGEDRKEVLRLRTEQRYLRKIIAIFEPWNSSVEETNNNY